MLKTNKAIHMYAYLYSDKYGCIQKSLEGNPPNLHREACDGGKTKPKRTPAHVHVLLIQLDVFLLGKCITEGGWAKPSRFSKQNS